MINGAPKRDFCARRCRVDREGKRRKFSPVRWLTGAVVVAMVFFGASTAGASTSPYGLYKVNGHHLFLDCYGTGRPTVVLESGLGAPFTSWDAVNELAQEVGTEVCAYDRYGVGSSDALPASSPAPTVDQAVNDLHMLLQGAGVSGPYVLAGASMGGLIAREYAHRFPKDVVGMVLLDSAPDDWDIYTGTETFVSNESINVAAASATLRRSDHLGNKPLVVVQAGDDSSVQSAWANGKKDFQSYWNSRQRALSRLSTDSLLVIAPGVPHDVITTDPVGLSAYAMRLVATAARAGTKLPACDSTRVSALGAKCL
jgi:thioesterase domain-containing protein